MTHLSFAPLRDAPADPVKVHTTPVLDAALDGGYVPGAVILIAGAPGAGKTTLLLQAVEPIPHAWFVTGEQSAAQIALVAKRLEIETDALIAASDDVDSLVADIIEQKPPLVIVDSLQRVRTAHCKGALGSLAQMRASGLALIDASRRSGSTIIIVCHETKAGGFAGPRAVEHDVDVAIRLERSPRQIVAIKNRMGRADIVVPVAMTAKGLVLRDGDRDLAGEVHAVTDSIARMADMMAELRRELHK
jgi:DNA repair protein RadA/Sms